MDRWLSGPSAGPGPSGAPAAFVRDPKISMTAVLVYPSDRNGAVRIVETTLSHTQSILSPYSVHVQFHLRGSTCPWTLWTTGVAKGMVEGAGSGMAGVRDDIQQRVERRTPSVAGQMRFHGAEAVGGTGALPDGRAPGGRGQGVRWCHGVSIRNGHP
jgi:hypothetical protein